MIQKLWSLAARLSAMNSTWVYPILASILALAGLFVVLSLRNSSRLQKRLFALFFLLSFIPAVAVLLINWKMSERHLAVLDSPGLRQANESAVALARRVLDPERWQTQSLADSLAAGCSAAVAAGAPLPLAPEGGAYRLADGTARTGSRGPLLDGEAWSRQRVQPGEPRRVLLDQRQYLVARSGGATDLTVLRPLQPALANQLDAIARGGSGYRQLRLYYGSLLRGDAILTLAAVGFALLIVSLVLSRRFAREIAGPLRELVLGTERVAQGHLDHRVRADAVDELGQLVDAFNDMTAKLSRSKDELVRAERIAAWQGIARRLAHEIKNPLTPISLSMHRIGKVAHDPAILECVDTVLEETENLRRLADEFSLYARLPAPRIELVDLGPLVRGVVDLYTTKARVAVDWLEKGDELIVDADPGQLRQVFSNLVKNALEAMGGQGDLRVHLEGNGDHVLAQIHDSGPGFGQDPLAMFEPYATSKASGTGLGLAIARKIVEDHGGSLRAYDHPSGGAVVEVDLLRKASA